MNFEHGKDQVNGRLIFNVLDRSADIITVYVWGELSSTKIKEGDLIVMNGARVSHFGGKSLNCSHDHCKLLVNPALDLFADDLNRFVDVSRCPAYSKAPTPEAEKEEEIKAPPKPAKRSPKAQVMPPTVAERSSKIR